MTTDSIVVACSACGKKFRGAAKLAGRSVKCPACGAPIAVPSAAGAPPHVAPPPPRIPAAVGAPAASSDWPPQDHSGWRPPEDGDRAYETAPIPPIYAPPAGVQPVAPPVPRKPLNTKLIAIIGGSVVGVAAICLVLFMFVFVSPEQQLLGTWQAKPPENEPLFKDLSMEITFEKGGKFTGATNFGPLSTKLTGTWELNGKKLTTKTDIPTRLSGVAAAAGRNLQSEVMEIVELDSRTLKLRKEGDKSMMEFVRK
jgi:DNA-directed RNA polymerase subunit RPC12/RpoP